MRSAGNRTFSLRLDGTFRELYHGRHPVAYRAIEELPGPKPGLRMALASNMPDVTQFLVAHSDDEYQPCPDGVVTLRFQGEQQEERSFRVKAARVDGTESPEHTVTVRFDPKPTVTPGSKTVGNNTVRLTARPFLHPVPAALEDWSYPEPTDEERGFAQERWGDRLAGVEGDYARAKALARVLMEELWPHSGRPSPAMRGLTPFQQYERMVAGEDHGFCVQFSSIFDCACKCFGLLSRRLGLCESPWASHRLFVTTSPNHAITEVFDRETDGWVLVDLRMYMLGAFLGEEGPLTAAEFIAFLNEPRRRERLHLLIYDPETKTERLTPLPDCPRPNLDCYEGWGRTLTFRKV